MQVTVAGAGSAGLATGTCLAEMGRHVVCPKADPHETERAMLKRPLILDGRNLYEPALMREFGTDDVGVGHTAAPAKT